jgi:uncharacterized protein YndB with AHSA1/START domain
MVARTGSSLPRIRHPLIKNPEGDSMPIKKDETGKRWVEMQLIVPGTPEQVWQAMATGPGNAAWFTKATIEERAGGALMFHFGPEVTTKGEVIAWEPPHRFSYVEREWSEGAPPVATEITITSRAGNECVVRMVHSLFSSTDQWDDQMESFENGWPGFFEVLRIYLANFAGMKAASFQTMSIAEGDHLAVWSQIIEKLNLVAANVDEKRAISQPQNLSGVVERAYQDSKVRVITLRLDAPAPGVAMVGTYRSSHGIDVSICMFFYGDDAETLASQSERKWSEWLKQQFPSSASTSASCH